jgi:prepilin-type N-terminal cleavage/methylation domain-containing protein
MTQTGFRNKRGFSLVELSVMLSIAAVMAAITIPMLTSSMRSMQLASDTRKIASAMSYAKLSAVSQMTRHQLIFNIYGNQWSLFKWNRDNNSYELQQDVNQLSLGTGNSGISFRSASGTAPDGFLTTSSTTITFDARGIPNDRAIIYLSNEEMDYAISVSLSGKVQIWSYRDYAWVPV